MAAGVYWKGNDGNVWVKGDQGTNSAGAWDANTNNYWMSRGFDYIPDPNPANNWNYGNGPADTAPAPRAPAPAGGSTGAAPKVLNQAGIDVTQGTINELPGILEAALAAERQKYGNTVNQFNAQEEGQRKTYGESTTTNLKNYDATFMDSLRAGIHGLGGLLGLLRGTGAAGGTAEETARDTVGGVTANDIRTGADTRNENQSGLDTTLSTFLSDLGLKRKMNEDALVNNERAYRRDSDTQLQDLYGKMAGFYGDVGDTGHASEWMHRAGEITPRIAANTRTQVSPYDTTPVAVKAPELSAFAAPTQPTVTTAPEGQVGSGIFTMTDPRRRKDLLAPVGV